jgi:hypothetical protein
MTGDEARRIAPNPIAKLPELLRRRTRFMGE